MSSASYFVSPQRTLVADRHRTGAADPRCAPPRDLRRGAGRAPDRAMARAGEPTPTGRRRSTGDRPVVLACRYGHELSQMVAADLRGAGIAAQVLAAATQAWSEAGLPLVDKAALDRFAPKRPSLWVTRRRPKIDRVACPWLIRRFIDPQARILFVDPPEVAERRAGDRRDPVRHRGRRDLATRASAARSTPCSSCSGWRASRRSRASR